MKERIEEIFKNSFYEIIDNPNLLSIFVVGSMAKENYIEKKSNDYDIRFILKKMNVDDYQELLLFLDKRKKEIEELGYGCEVSDIIGPVKMENVKDKLDSKELFELNTKFTIEEKDLVYLIDQNKTNNIIVNNFTKLLK